MNHIAVMSERTTVDVVERAGGGHRPRPGADG